MSQLNDLWDLVRRQLLGGFADPGSRDPVSRVFNTFNQFLGGQTTTPRRLRLLGCAGCRLLGPRLNTGSEEIIVASERLADELITEEELQTLAEGALAHEDEIQEPVRQAVNALAHNNVLQACLVVLTSLGSTDPRLLTTWRDLFANYPPLAQLKHWRQANDGLVQRMARTIYAERRFEDLPILADAVEEAGCDSKELLDHLRGPGPHYLGCRALDLLAGFE